MSLNIEGAIKNKAFKGFTDKGQPVPPRVAHDNLRLMLARGQRLMLIGNVEDCPNFDPVTGCPGHEMPDEEFPDPKIQPWMQ